MDVIGFRHTLGGTGKENGTEVIDAQPEQLQELRSRGSDRRRTRRTLDRGIAPHGGLRPGECRCYYVATRIAWGLTFPRQQSLPLFPPHAVLVCILLIVPTRHWWAYVFAAALRPLPGDAAGELAAAVRVDLRGFRRGADCRDSGGDSRADQVPLNAITLRDAILFVLIAVVLVPFGTAFWGASFTVSYGFGTSYWIEWRNLGISNAVTTVVLVPASCWVRTICSSDARERVPETGAGSGPRRCVYGGAGNLRIRSDVRGSQHVAALSLYADSPAHLGGAPLRPWRNQRLDVDHYGPGDLGNHARARPVPDRKPQPRMRRHCSYSSW